MNRHMTSVVVSANVREWLLRFYSDETIYQHALALKVIKLFVLELFSILLMGDLHDYVFVRHSASCHAYLLYNIENVL